MFGITRASRLYCQMPDIQRLREFYFPDRASDLFRWMHVYAYTRLCWVIRISCFRCSYIYTLLYDIIMYERVRVYHTFRYKTPCIVLIERFVLLTFIWHLRELNFCRYAKVWFGNESKKKKKIVCDSFLCECLCGVV